MTTRKRADRAAGKKGKEVAAAGGVAAPDVPAPAAPPPPGAGGDYIVLNGQRLNLDHHPTDFSVTAPTETLAAVERTAGVTAKRIAMNVTRMRAPSNNARDTLMDDVRREAVAHHIYTVQGTGEEIVIDERIFLTMRQEDPEELEKIIEEFKLVPEGRMGRAHVLRVTEASERNPLKISNAIAQLDTVESCVPEVLVPHQLHQTPLASTHPLFRRQWYLASELMSHADLDPSAGVRAPEAWQITLGDPNIVIAVIDDGFDLGHPAFLNKKIHTAKRDFAVSPEDTDPLAEDRDYHGTCVASIATGSLDGRAMVGVAPKCTLLPVRIGFGPMAAQVDILDVLRYVSKHADVVNCSFGTGPASFDPFHPEFRNAVTELTRSGGRRGKGLVIVFSAGNDDAPTLLRGPDNKNGVRFVRTGPFGAELRVVPAGQNVFSGHPLTRGVIVVGAMTSLKRKSGYSSWGQHLTVTAPSNNMHYITSFIAKGVNDAVRDKFVANYRGLGQVAASNRPGKGEPFTPLADDPLTTSLRENFYTERFGGTSGAAPVVSGVAALMLSVNPSLTADEVRQILMATADRDLDFKLDLPNDPNIQGLGGEFVNGHSLLFGAGKVNALRAVERARALAGPSVSLSAVATANGGFESARSAAPAAEPLALVDVPDTPEECNVWRHQQVRRRIRAAIAAWAQEPIQNITSDKTLGQLAKGVPWGMAQQLQLVQTTNNLDVFAPFNSRMQSPALQPASRTVAEWEGVVWMHQSPQTFCFVISS